MERERGTEIQGRNRSRKQRGGVSQRRAEQKEIFQPTRMGKFGEALREANVPQDLIGHEDRWRYITQTKRIPRSRKRQQSPSPIRPYSPKHQETEGKKFRTRSTFKTDVETTKGQL